MKKNQLNKRDTVVVSIKQLTTFVLVLCFTQFALASGKLQGGLNEAQNNLTMIKTWGITIAGVGAIVYLLWKGVETWRGRGDWGDFGMAVVHVALAGAAATLAGWAFGVFA